MPCLSKVNLWPDSVIITGVQALLMVMTTCLLIYSAIEYKIKQALEKSNQSFPDMKKKQTQKPTAQWVFQCFQGIELLYIHE